MLLFSIMYDVKGHSLLNKHILVIIELESSCSSMVDYSHIIVMVILSCWHILFIYLTCS